MDSSSSNTEFRDKLIKLALPRLIVDAFGMGVDIELLKYYGHYISNLDQLDEMLKTDEKGRSRAGDLALKTQVQRIIFSSTKVLEVLQLAKKEVCEIRKVYTNAIESHACATSGRRSEAI